MKVGLPIEAIFVTMLLIEVIEHNGGCISHDEIIDLIAIQYVLNLLIRLCLPDFDYLNHNIVIGK